MKRTARESNIEQGTERSLSLSSSSSWWLRRDTLNLPILWLNHRRCCSGVGESRLMTAFFVLARRSTASGWKNKIPFRHRHASPFASLCSPYTTSTTFATDTAAVIIILRSLLLCAAAASTIITSWIQTSLKELLFSETAGRRLAFFFFYKCKYIG